MKHLLIILGALVAVTSCTSGKKQFEKGNYEVAVSQSVNRLRNSPGNKKAASTLKKAYPLAERLHLSRIQDLKNGNEKFKWDQITVSYSRLNQMYEEITRCPVCIKLLPGTQSYRSEYNEAAGMAAEEQYLAGIEELNKRDRLSAKVAFGHFMRVEELRRNYKDTPQKLEEARSLATVHVLLDQIPVHSRTLGLSHEFFQNRLHEALDNEVNEFVRFYSPIEVQRMQINLDHIIVIQFDDFVVGQVYQREKVSTISKDSVVVGTTEVDGVSQDVIGTVEAEFTSYTKYEDSKGLLDVRIFDAATNRVLTQRKLPGEFNWVSEWATFQGDKRALSDEQYELTRFDEPPIPTPQFLFEQFCKPIYSQAYNHIIDFYRGF